MNFAYKRYFCGLKLINIYVLLSGQIMINNKVFKVLKVLNKNEFKNLAKFINSAYFNSNKNIIRLFNHISLFHPVYSDHKLTKEHIYGEVYGGSSFNMQILSNLFSEFYRLVENFLANEQLSAEPFTGSLLTIRKLTDKLLINETLKKIEQGFKFISRSEMSTLDKHINRVKLYNEKQNTINFTADHYGFINSEKKRSETFAYSSVIEMLELAGNIHVYQQSFPAKEQNIFFTSLWNSIDFDKLIAEYEENLNEENFYLYLFLLEYKCLYGTQSEMYYEKIKTLLFERISGFNHADKTKLWDLMTKIIDYSLVNYSPIKARIELHEVNKIFIANGTLATDKAGFINDNVIRSLFSAAILVDDWDWAEDFVEKYYTYLHPDIRMNNYNYLIGQCKFHSRKFEEAIECFSKVKFKDIIINIDVRLFYLECYYELGYYDELFASIDTFKRFLGERKHIPASFKSDFRSFFKYIQLIVKLKINNTRLDPEILHEAENRKKFIEKKWIISKMKELL